jgi:hypothetical protein
MALKPPAASPDVLEPPPPAPASTGRETLAELAAEAQGQAAEAAAVADETANPPPPPPPEPTLELTGCCVGLVTVLGGILCGRAGVDPLSGEEANALGSAIAGVAALYLPADVMDPVTARWLALAGASAAIVLPRLGKRRETPAASSAPRPAVAAAYDLRGDGGAPLPPGPLTS